MSENTLLNQLIFGVAVIVFVALFALFLRLFHNSKVNVKRKIYRVMAIAFLICLIINSMLFIYNTSLSFTNTSVTYSLIMIFLKILLLLIISINILVSICKTESGCGGAISIVAIFALMLIILVLRNGYNIKPF